jgi:hypothetical protein
VFESDKHFQPSQMFASEAKWCPSVAYNSAKSSRLKRYGSYKQDFCHPKTENLNIFIFFIFWRRDTHHNDIQNNDTRQNL